MEHPTLNAALNFVSAVLLVLGYLRIRQRDFEGHKRLMLAALASSTLFLASYLTYHYQSGHTTCVATGWVRTTYFILLVPHVILAAVMVPPILLTVGLGWTDRRELHRKVAKITLPVWLYVSVTGVLVYFYVYHWFPELFVRAAEQGATALP